MRTIEIDPVSPDVDVGLAQYQSRETNQTGDCISCPVCNGSQGRRYPGNLTACEGCGHIFQTDLTVSASYDAAYAHQYDRQPVREMSALRWDFMQSYLFLSRNSKILDVGYGNGAFLKHAKSAGMRIFGIDLHNEDFGIPVVDYQTQIDFDLICFFDSLEHFPDFAPLLGLRSRHVVVSIPDTPGYVLDAPDRWRHYKPGEHLHYFSRTSLHRFMQRWGFPHRRAEGHPEDRIRGKLTFNGTAHDNILTAIYSADISRPATQRAMG